LSVPSEPLKKKKQLGLVYDQLVLEKLMKYYGFEKREQLMDFLKSQNIQDSNFNRNLDTSRGFLKYLSAISYFLYIWKMQKRKKIIMMMKLSRG
jgi:hypothetical protein